MTESAEKNFPAYSHLPYAVALKQRNKTLAAISISIPVFRATKEKIADVTRILLNARSRIEQELNTLQDINIGIDSHH